MAGDSDDPALDATQAQHPVTLASQGPSGPASPDAARPASLSNYQLGQLLGRGGMGDILLGRDQSIGRDVAVKRMRAERPGAEAVARFLREARIQARLEHPSIVPVHALGFDDTGAPYFTMKRLTGTTFAEQLAPAPPLQRALRMFAEVCLAVEFAHSKGVVHRDLKPSNIMIGDFGEVYVLDWGLARILDEREAESSIGDQVASLDGETEAGALLGTPGYMAPEQIELAHAVTPAADIYALGAILFEILAGEPLHPRGQGALTSTLKGIAAGPAARRPDRHVPPELDELCTAALALAPLDRPSAKELADRLEAYLDGDRDHERRQELARTYVTAAQAALASNDPARRAEAIQAAGRALALDAESTDAAAVIQTLMFSPSRQHPRELEEELTATEVTAQRRQGKAAMLSFLVILAYLAIAANNGVANTPFVLGTAGFVAALATYVWRTTRRRARPWQMVVLAMANATLAALLSRTYGSLIITPAITCVMAVSLTSYPQLIDRRGTVIGLLLASWLLPVVLELAGVLAPTFALDAVDGGLLLTSHVFALTGTHALAIVIGANLASIVVIGLFASALATSRRDALRQTEITAWHLRQLLPRAPGVQSAA